MIEPGSETWIAVRTHAEGAIEKARLRLEAPGLSATETEYERGRIAAMRDMLSRLAPVRPALVQGGEGRSFNPYG